MAETLGTAEVLVTANVEKALAEITRVETRLKELQSELKLTMDALPDSSGKPSGTPESKPSARSLGEATITPQLKGELADIPITIDAGNIATQIQSELDKHVFKIRIELDTADLQEMIIPVKGQMTGMAPGPAQHQQQTQANMVTNQQRDVVNASKGARNVERLGALASQAGVSAPASGNVDDVVRFYQGLIAKHNLTPDMNAAQMAQAIGVPQTAMRGVTKAVQGIAGSAPAPLPVEPIPPSVPPAQAIATGHATRAQRTAASTPARGLQLETSYEVLSAMDQIMGDIFAKAEYQDERSGVVSSTRSPEEILKGIYSTYSSPSDTRRSPIGRRKSGSPSVASPGRSSLFGGGMYYQGDLVPTDQRGPFFADQYVPGARPQFGEGTSSPDASVTMAGTTDQQGQGYLVATNAVAGYQGGPNLTNRIVLDPKTGKASGDLGENPLLGGFGMQIGKNKDDVVDLTPLARFASTGTLAQMFSQGGELGLRTEGANAPTGAVTGQQTILKRLIRGVVRDRFGQGVEDQLTEEALQPIIDNYFKPFLEVGNRARNLLNLGDQPNIIGATTLGGTSMEGSAVQGTGVRGELARQGGFRYGQTTEETYNAGAQGTRMGNPDVYWDPSSRTYKTAQPVVGTTNRDAAAAESQNRYENRERIRLGNRLPQDVAQRLGIGPEITIEELGKVVAQRSQIQENEPAFQQFINDMTKVYEAILDPNNIPSKAVEAGGYNPLGNPVLDENGKPVMEERMVHGKKQMVPKTRFDVQPGDEFTRQSFINNSIHRILTATDLPAQMGVGTLQPRASGIAGQFAQKSPIVSAMIRAITAKFYDTIDAADVAASEDSRRSKTGETLLTGDEFGALAAQISGTLPIDPKRAKGIADAIGTAEGLNSLGAGVVAVTIASPVPLPVTIVSGAAGGGGEGGGPPRKTTGGGGGSDDGGDDGKPDPSQPNDNINPKTGYAKGSAQDQAIMGRRQREEDSKRQQELFAANEQNRNRAPSEGRKTETIGKFDSYEAAQKARDQVQAVAADAELQIKRRGEGFELRRRINPGQSQTAAELQARAPKTEADRQREFEKGLAEQEQVQARQEKARIANETRAAIQQQRAEDPLRGQVRGVFNELYPGLMIDGQARQGPLSPTEQRSFDEQYNRLRTTASRRQRAIDQAEREGGKKPGGEVGSLSEAQFQALAQKRNLRVAGGAAAITPQDILREGEGGEGDEVLIAQQNARASLRSARGRIPQRALSTSIVQIAENLFGGVEKPLARIAAAEQEYTQLSKLATKEQEFVRKGRGLETRRGELKELLGRTPKEEREERMAIIKSLRENKMAINENNKEIDTWSKAVAEQTTKVEEMAKSAVGATDIFRNLGAGFIGGVGGAIVSQMVSQVAGVVMQAGALAMPTLDVMLGSGQTGMRRQQELAQVYGGSNFSQSTLNQEYVQRGFTSGEIERFSGSTSVGAQAIARANQLNERLELLRAESAAMAQQANSPAGSAAPYGASAGALLAANFPLLGQVDIGGSDSVAKMIGGIINQSMDRLTREEKIARSSQPDLMEARQAYEGYLAEPGLASGAEQIIRDQYQWTLSQDQIDRVLEGPIADAFDTLPKAVDDFLNTRLREAESQFRIEPGENEDLYKALEDAGNQFESDLLPSLRNNKLNITRQDGQPFNLQQDLPQLAIDLTQLDPETFAGNLAGSKSFQNALEVFRQQRQRQYIGQRATIGFQSLGNQIIDPGAGGRNLGIAGGVSQGFTREYEDLANQAQAFEDQGVEMMKALMPSQSGLIDEYTQLGDRLKELNEQSGRIKADQAMRSYALSVKQARFAVEDLQALTGKGEGSEIGRLERVNMLMQRRLQILQFEQQQRAINFQVAVAGFQAEGMTGAERAARLQHARREAAVQQEMLNLNRGMFGNQVQIVDQRNIRSLEVATDNLNNIIATFDENNKLAQIGARATLIQRNMQNLQSEWQHNLQTIMAIDEQRTEFMRTVGDETETLITEMDKTVTDPFDKAVGQFKTSQGTLAETVVAMQSNVISPFQEGIDTLATHVVALQDMFDGKQNSTLMVRDVTINQKITGTVVDYKELVDMIVEELGKQGIRTGQNTGGR